MHLSWCVMLGQLPVRGMTYRVASRWVHVEGGGGDRFAFFARRGKKPAAVARSVANGRGRYGPST